MSQKSQDAIDVLSKVIVDTIDKKLDTANFDKSQIGVVTAVNGNTYTISVFGSQYNITSDQVFTVGQSVVVTALQGDMKRLVCSPDNIGTMKTVDNKVKVVGDKLSSFIDKNFADTVNRINQIKSQVDKSFMSWFYDGAPTLENAPAKDWTTEDAKRVHIGDLYYDTTNGYSYEWVVNDGVYSWNKITDSGIQEALKNASKAQDTADGKRRIFYDTPSTPYDRGDMWAQGGTGDLLICNVARTITDSYHQTDWIPASKYTDDTKANEALDSANKANTDLAGFKTEYDSDLKVTKQQIESRVTKTTYTKDLNGLKTRVGAAETKISQNADAITFRATKEEVSTAKSDAISAAASDASTKANAAQSNAKAYTDAQLKITSESITSTVSRTYATKASLDVTNSNVSSAQSTANSAKWDAQKARNDVNALNTRVSNSETKISQNADAITLRATKEEVSAAKSDAIDSAAADATNKANAAERNAKSYAYAQLEVTNEKIETKVSKGDIASTINQTAQSVQIEASKINLKGAVTTEDISAYGLNAKVIQAGTITATEIKADTITAGNIGSGQIIRRLWQNASAGTYKGSNGATLPYQMSTFPAQVIKLEFSDLSQIQIIFKGNRFQSGGDNNNNCFSFSSMLVPLFNFADVNAGFDDAIFYTVSVPLPSARYRTTTEAFYVPDTSPVFSFRSFQVYYSKNSYGGGYLSIYFWDAAIQDYDGSISYGTHYNDWCIPYRIYGMK